MKYIGFVLVGGVFLVMQLCITWMHLNVINSGLDMDTLVPGRSNMNVLIPSA